MPKHVKKQYDQIDTTALKTYPMTQRSHKVARTALAELPNKDASAAQLLDSFPDFLATKNLRLLAQRIARAVKDNRPVIFAMGSHVIKTGCAPIVIDLIERGVLAAVAFNGSGGIHDYEMAQLAQTSEDVACNLHDGRFGMTTEASDFLAQAAKRGAEENIGLGAAIGALINEKNLPHKNLSILAAAHQANILATLHVAIGTDTIHMHPAAHGAHIGRASLIDFRRLCSAVADLNGGVWVNIGSAVILPEVFLKAVAIAKNLNANLDDMFTANLDMLPHYRTRENVLSRPVKNNNSCQIIGHHEITLPLLRMQLLQLL